MFRLKDAVAYGFRLNIDKNTHIYNSTSGLMRIDSGDQFTKGLGAYTGFVVPLDKSFLQLNLNKANVIFFIFFSANKDQSL